MALSNVALFGAAFLTPVLAGKITHSLGWQWTFYLLAIFAAAALPLTFFLVPETAFRRPDHLNTDFESFLGQQTEATVNNAGQSNDCTASKESQPLGEQQQKHARTSNLDSSMASSWNDGPSRGTGAPTKVSYLEGLKPFNGRKTDENFFKLLLRPLPLFFHPAILWVSLLCQATILCSVTADWRFSLTHWQACLIQGAIIGWTVFIGVVLAAIFLGPPLWFNEVQTGYLYTGAFIGSILGLILSGLLSDSMNRIMVKLNRGRYEPEFRILLVLFQLIFCGVGLYGFGIVAEDVGRYGWLVVDVFFAFVVIGMVMGAVASALYIVDAHRKWTASCRAGASLLTIAGNIAIESFTCMLIFKNIFSFVLTFFAYDWLVSNGIRPAFLAISSIQMGICVLSIPMCACAPSSGAESNG